MYMVTKKEVYKYLNDIKDDDSDKPFNIFLVEKFNISIEQATNYVFDWFEDTTRLK